MPPYRTPGTTTKVSSVSTTVTGGNLSDPAVGGRPRWHSRQPSGPDRLHEAGVIGLGLVGVLAGEAAQRVPYPPAAAEVAGDHRGTARAGVPLGEQHAADGGVVGQGGGVQVVEHDRALHVPELAHVV